MMWNGKMGISLMFRVGCLKFLSFIYFFPRHMIIKEASLSIKKKTFFLFFFSFSFFIHSTAFSPTCTRFYLCSVSHHPYDEHEFYNYTQHPKSSTSTLSQSTKLWYYEGNLQENDYPNFLSSQATHLTTLINVVIISHLPH